VSGWLERASGVEVVADRFTAEGPDGPVELTNLVAVVPGASAEAIVLLAHRDDRAPGPGVNDNASGTAVLVQLARTFAPLDRTKTLVLASVDGGTLGQAGARRLAERPPSGVRPVAAIALDGVGGGGTMPILFAGDDGARAGAALPRAAIQALETGGVPAAPPDVATQLLDLVQPAGARGAQAPFVDRGVSAVQIGDGGDPTGAERITRARLERVGLALDTLVQRLDTTPETADAADAYVMLGERALPAWVLTVLAISLLVAPALVAGGLLFRAPGARQAWWPATVHVGRVALPLVGALAAARLAAAVGVLPDEPWVHRAGDVVGRGGLAAVVAGALLGGLAALRLRTPPSQLDAEDAAPATIAVTLAAAVAGAGLVLLGSAPTALLLVPALHAWALLPLVARAGLLARLLVLLVPGAVTFALFLAARGADAETWIAAVASREVPGAVALGLAIALAALLVALPVAAGIARATPWARGPAPAGGGPS